MSIINKTYNYFHGFTLRSEIIGRHIAIARKVVLRNTLGQGIYRLY